MLSYCSRVSQLKLAVQTLRKTNEITGAAILNVVHYAMLKQSPQTMIISGKKTLSKASGGNYAKKKER